MCHPPLICNFDASRCIAIMSPFQSCIMLCRLPFVITEGLDLVMMTITSCLCCNSHLSPSSILLPPGICEADARKRHIIGLWAEAEDPWVAAHRQGAHRGDVEGDDETGAATMAGGPCHSVALILPSSFMACKSDASQCIAVRSPSQSCWLC